MASSQHAQQAMRTWTAMVAADVIGMRRSIVRSPIIFLVAALGFSIWMLASFVITGSSNMPTIVDRLIVGLMADFPLLVIALAMVIVIARRGTASLSVPAMLLLSLSLIVGLLWAFALAMSSG
jgi:hypothetical protein